MIKKTLNQGDIETLIHMGLTQRQAKIYITLLQSGISTTRTISQISKIPRPDIYRIISKLQEIGLTEKIIDKNAKFEAIPLQDGIQILLQRKNKEFTEMHKDAKKLLKKCYRIDSKKQHQTETRQFILISERESFARKIDTAVQNSQYSIDFIYPQCAFPRAFFFMAESCKKAMKRGVRIRWIVEKSGDEEAWPKFVNTITKTPLFKLRTVPEALNSRLGMIDKKEAFIDTNTRTSDAASSILWTNNVNVLTVFQDYFENLWVRAKEKTI